MANNEENLINGKEANKRFIEAIKRRRKKLFEDAKPFAESSNAADVVDKIDDDNYIKKEDKEEYDILMTLLSYLDFEKAPAENTYEFRGLEYKSGNSSYRTTVYLSKENALKVSKLAHDYEDKLARSNSNPDDLKMSIKFPVELLLLKYKGTNMPGCDYEAPEPKTAAESRKEYEESLESYYHEHGVTKAYDEDAGFREAYPHERVNYRQNPPQMTNVTQNGYYEETVRDINAQDLDLEHGDPGLEPGEQRRITGVDRPLGRRIGDAYLDLKSLFKSKTLRAKLLKGLVIAGLGIGAIACLKGNPIITIMLAAGVGGGLLGIKYVLPPVQRAYGAIKKKLKDWLFGPELTQTPEGEQEEPEEEEQMTPEELNNRIATLQTEINALETEISRLETEIAGLDDTDPQKQVKEEQLAEKRALHRAKLNEVSALLHNYDAEHTNTRGGLGR